MQPYQQSILPGAADPVTRLPRRQRMRIPPAAVSTSDDNPAGSIIGAVQWNAAYVGFLLYIFVIVTYRVPLATPAILLALIGLFLQPGGIRVPAPVAWFGIYILWGVLGYVQTEHPSVVWENLIQYSKVWLIALVAVNVLRTPGQIRFFLIFFLACFATHPARGTIFNYLGGFTEFGRAAWNHIYGNPNDMAALTFLPLGIAAGLVKDSNKWIRYGALASVAVLPIVIFLTQSRGAFLALALFATLTWSGQRRKVRSLALLAIVAAIALFAAPSGFSERVSGLSQGTEADSSSKQRWAIWQIATEIIKDHPVTGVGLGAYSRVHSQYAPDIEVAYRATGRKDTHSTYLKVIAETGYPGFAIFLAMVVTTILLVERARRRLKRALPQSASRIWYLEVSLFAYLTAGIFGSFSHLALFYVHLGVLVATALAFSRALVPEQPRGRRAGTISAAHV
jgi:probable O-glycosylation ligase (exosortase A-associated)